MIPRPLMIVIPLLGSFLSLGAQQPASPTRDEAARVIARLALVDLRLRDEPSQADYALAGELLGMAHDRTPTDAELLRRRIEAAYNAGDESLTLALTRDLVRLDPADTVAQLRVVTASIARAHTVDDRLALYDRFLSEQGRGLDPSVRSRLALDAALLLRERGDTAGFVRMLGRATSLDSTHKEAAALAAAYFSSSVDDARGRADLLSNLLYSDPIDPHIHFSLARELAQGGAFVGASRFHANARNILQATRATASPEHASAALVLLWLRSGPEATIADLNRTLNADRERVRQELRSAYGDSPPPDAPKVSDVRLGLTFELVRIAAAAAAGDAKTLDEATTDYERSQGDAVKRLSDPLARPRGMTPEAAQAAIRQVAIDVQIIRLWTGGHLDVAMRELSTSSVNPNAANPGERIIYAFHRARLGDGEAALPVLESVGTSHPLTRLALGYVYESMARDTEAAACYAAFAREQPLTVPGAWARTRAKVLGAYSDADTLIASDLEAAARAIPAWLDTLTTDPYKFVALTVRGVERSGGSFPGARLHVRLRNVSPVPLSLGTDRAISSRILFTPRPTGDADDLGGLARPEVIDLDRRLRLMPMEGVDAVVPVDLGFTGWLLETRGTRATRVRWRAIQGFVLDQTGAYQPGPMCVSTESDLFVRSPSPLARATLAEVLDRIASMGEAEAGDIAAAVRARLLDPAEVPVAEAEALVHAIVARYPALPIDARAILVCTLPQATLVPAFAPLDAAMLEDPSPEVLGLALVSRVRRADDPALVRAALAASDPRLIRIITGVKESLARGNRGIARDDLARVLRREPPR